MSNLFSDKLKLCLLYSQHFPCPFTIFLNYVPVLKQKIVLLEALVHHLDGSTLHISAILSFVSSLFGFFCELIQFLFVL